MHIETKRKEFPELNINPFNLFFADSNQILEKPFIENYFEKSLKQIRVCIILSILVYAVFGIVDIKAVPQLKNILWIIRYAIYCPVAICVLIFTFSKYFKKYFQLIISVSAVFASLGLLIINSLAASSGFYSYNYAIFFTLIFIYNLTRLKFIYATLSGWTIIILYNCLALFYTNFPIQVFIDSNILFVCINVFGMASCYFMEYYEKKNYFLVTLLNKEKESVENANQKLEKKVSERTYQLEYANAELKEANIILKEEISERLKTGKALNESEERFRATFERAPIGICNTAIDGSYLSANQELCNILGYSFEELQKITFTEITYPDDLQSSMEAKTMLIDGSISIQTIEKRYFRKNGSIIWTNLTVMLMRDSDSRPLYFISVIQDITDRKKTENKIVYLSYHDKLTGLYNRRFYEEEIKRLDTERNLPISIIIGDVNGLKLINDAFGHDKGDELLQKAATAIQNACRIEDIVARWGGDEFVILLPKTKAEEAEEIVKRIKDVYLNEYVNAIRISISFGWDTKIKNDEDILKVLKSAEDYMYKHKVIENQSMKGNTVNTIINTLLEKNPREEQHSKRVGEICENIGTALGFSEIEVGQLKVVGHLHDIGKIAINESILNKSGKLTKHEQDEIRRHPAIGYRILSSSYEMLELAGYILAHHERWDGTGYPKGLKGEAIPKVARIIALADSYDAMTSERPYRKALSEEAAFREIRENAGIQFDPDIARIFIEKILGKPWD